MYMSTKCTLYNDLYQNVYAVSLFNDDGIYVKEAFFFDPCSSLLTSFESLITWRQVIRML